MQCVAGLAAKAGKKASSAAEAKSVEEAVNSVAQVSERPASEYPSWLDNLTKHSKTLGELKRTPAEERSEAEVRLCLLTYLLRTLLVKVHAELMPAWVITETFVAAGLEVVEVELEGCNKINQFQQG